MILDPKVPLGEAQDWVRQRIEDGVHCPCCTQYAKVYRRKLNRRIALTMIAMYRKSRKGWVYLPTIGGSKLDVPSARSGEVSFAQHWGLIQRSEDRGYWQITELGESFLLNGVKIPKYARIYDGRLLNLDPEQTVSIVDVLGIDFDYNELMAGI